MLGGGGSDDCGVGGSEGEGGGDSGGGGGGCASLNTGSTNKHLHNLGICWFSVALLRSL